jgi:hypothetical protein
MESLRISPNTVLTRNGLEVNGEPRLLGHRDAFVMVARVTGAMVATILERVFPVTTAAPLPSGAAVTTTVSAWEDYSQQLLTLSRLPADSDDIPVLGQVLVQWCIAAEVAAVVGDMDIVHEPEFLVVRYLAEHGAAALAHTTQSWHAYLDWLAWSQTPAAAVSQLTGEGERRRPIVHSPRMATPWPGLLGANLGDASRLPEQVSRHATDIIVTGETTICEILGRAIRVPTDFGLVDRFNSAVAGDASARECSFNWEVAGKRYLVRAQRSPAPCASRYVFRLLPTAAPSTTSLDALMAQ